LPEFFPDSSTIYIKKFDKEFNIGDDELAVAGVKDKTSATPKASVIGSRTSSAGRNSTVKASSIFAS
jgi:hypothetical protein